MQIIKSVDTNSIKTSLVDSGIERGHFTIDIITHSLTISIDDDLQGRGISTLLIKTMVDFCKTIYPNIRHDQLLFIDGDGSGGFWEHIGMKPNRYGYNYRGHRQLEGRGYEKVITFRELQNYCFRKVICL